MKRKEKTILKRFFGSRWFLIIAFVVAVLTAVGYARAYYQDYKIKQEIMSLQEEIRKMEYKKLESMQILKYVASDAFVEEKARTELNLKKPGENVLFIKDSVGANEALEIIPVEERTLLGNPAKWWYYFSHKNVPNK